jgi:dTMP kinase
MIALVGVDGSGKSTTARRLAQELTVTGTPARYFENGGGRPIMDGLAHRLGRRDGRHLLGRRPYLAIEVSFRALAISRAVILTMLTRQVAIMDRYTYCQYAIMRARGDSTLDPTACSNVDADTQPRERLDAPADRPRPQPPVEETEARRGGHAERLVRLLYAAFPKPDVTFYLALPADEAANRVELRGRDLEDPAYLAALDEAYRALPEFAEFKVLDASGPVENLITTAMHEITEHR